MTVSKAGAPRNVSGTVLGWFAARPGRTTIGVSVLAAAPSFLNAWHVSMWVDEGYTISGATRSLLDLWRMVHVIDVVHSVKKFVLHPWLAITGVSDVSVRLPNALAVGAATAGFMVLARQLSGPRTAMTSGFVFAVLPRMTGMGIEGRSYAMTAAIAVWMTVLFVSLTRRPTLGKHVGYAALGAFAGSLNIFMVLLLGAHGLTLLASARLRFRRIFWSWLAAAVGAPLGALPVLATAMSQSAQIGPTRLSLVGCARSVLVNQWFLAETPTIYLSGGESLGLGPGSQLWRPASVLPALLCWAVIAYAVLRRRPAGSPRVATPNGPCCCPGSWRRP